MEHTRTEKDDIVVQSAIAEASQLYEQYLLLSRVTNLGAVLNTSIQEPKTWGAPLTLVIPREA